MPLSEEGAAALRADLERLQREKGAAEAVNREYEAKLERLRKERSLGISFDGQGGGGSADRRGTSATTMASMVHDGGAGGRWQGQRVTPVVARSRAKRDGLWPGMFALMATQEDIARSIDELSLPDVVEQELPSKLA